MNAVGRLLATIGLLVVVGCAGLGAIEVVNKFKLAEVPRPTFQPVESDVGLEQ
ncbi:hypothetical protein CCP3SC15_5060001 [Gammaproteobacteria bacterium]